MRDCGTCHPPPDGSRDREIVDRFADLLREIGRPPFTPDELRAARTADGRPIRSASPAARYRRRLLVWRMTPAALDVSERLADG